MTDITARGNSDKQDGDGRKIASNALLQILGRFSVSAGRFAIAILIIRFVGPERFGEYSLILSMLLVAEWLVDFGISEIGVRTISQQPDRKAFLMRAAAVIGACQALLASLIMLSALYFMEFPAQIIRAGAIGVLGLFFYAGIVVYRIHFRVLMSIGKNVAAEVIGLLTMLPLVVWACIEGATVDVFVACYLLSRVIHFCVVAFLGRNSIRFFRTRTEQTALRQMFVDAVPLGLAGLLNSVHLNMIPVMLSKMVGMNAVGEYSYTVRFSVLIVMVIQSLNFAFLPLLSAYWKHDKAKFSEIQQNALEVSILIGAGMFVAMNGSADFIVSLAGAELADAALVLTLMSWLVLLRIVTMPITPLIVVAGGQMKVLWIAVLSVGSQFLALLWLIPSYAAIGAVVASLLVKALVGTLPIVVISGRLTGCPLEWEGALKTLLCAVAALWLGGLIVELGSFWAGFLCFGIYWVLTAVTGALSKNRMLFIYSVLANRRAMQE